MDESRGDERGEPEGSQENDVEGAAREEVRRVVEDLSSLSFRLVGVAAVLPRSAQPRSSEDLEDDEPGGPLDDLRTAIACALFDHLDAALSALRQALDRPPSPRVARTGMPRDSTLAGLQPAG